MNVQLPVEQVIPDLIRSLQARNSVLCAPPGAGKTTRVPPALLKADFLGGKKIVMLEPRRLAARAAAYMMAELLNEKVGKTVGYQVRMERCISSETRIEVVTEGILTRRLQHDPELKDTGLVIFDEFHERNLQSDLGLALALDSQDGLREDLRILVMSATMDHLAVAAILGPNTAVIRSEGQCFDVAVRRLKNSLQGDIRKIIHHAAAAVMDELRNGQGDILVFMPGAGEIKMLEKLLYVNGGSELAVIAPLFGNLSLQEQDKAIKPSADGSRKVVIATSIAETSLTIPGISSVIDCGLTRVPVFDPGTGMTSLHTTRLSRASATQRCGRAGRLSDGRCLQLWTDAEQQRLTDYSKPEILTVDLAFLRLELAMWGVTDYAELKWLDQPPKALFAQAGKLLQSLGALDKQFHITAHGRKMAALGLHPRLAHMLLKAQENNMLPLACELAALLEEKDIFTPEAAKGNADIRDRIKTMRQTPNSKFVKSGLCRRIIRHRNILLAKFREPFREIAPDNCGLLLAFAYTDRIGMQRTDQHSTYLLSCGRGAHFPGPDSLDRENFIVAAALDGAGENAKIFLAAPFDSNWFEEFFADDLQKNEIITWNNNKQTVEAFSAVLFGALPLKKSPVKNFDADRTCKLLISKIASEGFNLLPWTRDSQELRARINFLNGNDQTNSWPDLSDAAMLATIEQWLGPFLYGMKSFRELQQLNMKAIIENTLNQAQKNLLERLVPARIKVPSGSSIRLDYASEPLPLLKVRLQEMFGCVETPRILDGRIALKIHLLSPAMRTVQVTSDLKSFWGGAYEYVKKEMKGRYPKHNWPDDPLTAAPDGRAKKNIKNSKTAQKYHI